MSLRAFHLVFVIASVTSCLAFGAWCFQRYDESGHPGAAIATAASLAGALALIGYGIVFYRKIREARFS